MFIGWLIGFLLCFFKLDNWFRVDHFEAILGRVDYWIMGAFCCAGTAAAISWLGNNGWQGNPFVVFFVAIIFSTLTGAGGGLAARFFASLSFEFRGFRKSLFLLLEWFFSAYTSTAIFVGIFSFIILVPTRILFFLGAEINSSMVVESNVFFRQILEVPFVDGIFLIKKVFYNDVGFYLITCVMSGFFACYNFRVFPEDRNIH